MATQVLSIREVPELLPATQAQLADPRSRVHLGGIRVDRLDLPLVANRFRTFLHTGQSHQIVTVNLDFLNIARHDAEFRATVNSADMVVADGMPLVWASRIKGHPLPARITGHELIHECGQLSSETGRGFFLLGAAPGIAEVAGARLEQRYPGLKVVGTYSPTFDSQEEDDHVIEMIERSRPGFLLVALGAPRQDLWIHRHRQRLSVPVCIGVGCVLDILAGSVKRAPEWIQQSGLEWSYRLAQEPRRLWRRYVLNDLPMFGRLMAETLRPDRAAEETHRRPGSANEPGELAA